MAMSNLLKRCIKHKAHTTKGEGEGERGNMDERSSDVPINAADISFAGAYGERASST